MAHTLTHGQGCRSRVVPQLARAGWCAIILVGLGLLPIGEARAQGHSHEALIPVLGTTMEKPSTGQVVYLVLSFEQRGDEGGLAVLFKSTPGRFSPMTETDGPKAIYRGAPALWGDPEGRAVKVDLPYP